MRKCRLLLESSRGVTLLEMIIVLAIVAILATIANATYNSIRARVRYAKIAADLNAIAKAASTDMGAHEGDWAADEITGIGAPFTAAELGQWPIPPCPGWVYDWDNWSALPENVVRVTLRRGSDYSAIYSVCLDSRGNNCLAPDIFGGPPIEFATLSSHSISCNE